jgi:hypothetical protein
MSRNAIVYQSRNRFTGTLTQTIDTKHPDCETLTGLKFIKGKRYAFRCVEHKTVGRTDEHYVAGRAIAHVDEWCKRCQQMIAKGTKLANKKAMITGAPSAKTGRGDLRQSSKNNAFDKRWTNGGNKRQPKKEQQRKQDQQHTQTAVGASTIVDASEVIEA